jgi:hypothetical protein
VVATVVRFLPGMAVMLVTIALTAAFCGVGAYGLCGAIREHRAPDF